MRAPLSIVIPTLDAEDELPGALAALGEGLAAGLIRELIVSDGGSADATCAIAEAAGALLVSGPAGRGGQLRRGAGVADGDWLLFLHADSHLAPGWAEAVTDHFRQNPDKAGYFRLTFRTGGAAPRVVAGWANLRSWLFDLPYGDQGMLISAKLYQQAGGFPDQPLMEDVALARALRGKLRGLRCAVHTSAERYRSQGWLRRGARNLLTLARYLLGADPARLVRFYDRR